METMNRVGGRDRDLEGEYNQRGGHWGQGRRQEVEGIQVVQRLRQYNQDKGLPRGRSWWGRDTIRKGDIREEGGAWVRMETFEKGKRARRGGGGGTLGKGEATVAERGHRREDVRLRKWARPARLECPRAGLGEGVLAKVVTPHPGGTWSRAGWGTPAGEVPGRGRTRAQWGTAGTVTCECSVR